MASCTCENWTLRKLSDALQNKCSDNRRISVPMFQRGKRWSSNQQSMFIDSLLKGYPVGTMLFYKRIEENTENFILVDGLQRGNSIKKYLTNPTEFFDDNNISNELCDRILSIVNCQCTDENRGIIRGKLTEFIRENKTFSNLQFYDPASDILQSLNGNLGDFRLVNSLIEVINEFFCERRALYEQIERTEIPVIIYQGAEENLPDIFDRINSQGTPLNQYEVYAAAWPVTRKFKITNNKIVEAVIKKYDSFIEDGFAIQYYDREAMRVSKEVNAFEYLFGLSKYLVGEYDILGFDKRFPDDTVNPLGFELVNACLNDRDKIKNLYENIYYLSGRIDVFERALYNAINFVSAAVSPITRFKGNNRSDGAKILHSKYQILSMISATFKEMYNYGEYEQTKDSWIAVKEVLSRNLRFYYVYDIITNYWGEGGPGKVYSGALSNRYLKEISKDTWNSTLDTFFFKSLDKTEFKKIANPTNKEYVILNCIYLGKFSAVDQLSSTNKFDVEHIATKEQMKKYISRCHGVGLPISCIANLCYLPDYANRSKKDSNFYQDKKYLSKIELDTVEKKYSFTEKADLEWMDESYSGPDDFEKLKKNYESFCRSRFEIMKKEFFSSMGISG